jgi:hypothetical protein
MFDEHPNLYADTSAFNVPVRGRFVRECLTEKLAPRLVHGSDFPVPVLGHWRWLQGIGSRADLRRCQAIKNVIERDYQFKLAWGFPPEHFTRIHVLLRKSQGVASGASAPGL